MSNVNHKIFKFEYHCHVKNFILIFLAILIIFQSNSQLWLIVNFKLNQDFIAKNLCENRGKPEMNCNGNCCLKKELQKQTKREKKAEGERIKSEQILFVRSQHIVNIKLSVINKKPSIDNVRSVLKGFGLSIFHPPPFVS